MHDPSSSRFAQPPAETLLAAIVDSSDDAIMSCTPDGIVTSWNRGAEQICGYAREEIVGKSCLILLPPDRQAEEQEILGRIGRGERVEHVETIWRRKDGAALDVSVTFSPVRGTDGQIMGVSKVGRDITAQKRNGRADFLLSAIVSSSDDAIVSKNLQGIITSWNEGAERIFGYTREEIVGQSVLRLLPKDRQDEELGILSRLRRGERVDHFETIRVRKNGEHFPVSLTISPVKDERGTIIGASKIARDITEYKRIAAEREQLLESERIARSQAEQASRMKDDFLSTVSHELRTPLNAIVGWTEVLGTGNPTPLEVAEGVDVIKRNAFMQAQIIDDLLDLGRITAGKMTLNVHAVELPQILRESISSVQHAAEQKQIQIKTILPYAPVRLAGDSKRLQQVIWNLLTNAIKFTPNGGLITVTVTQVNSHLDIAVADTGRGIDAPFLPYVFERFRQADSTTTRQHGGLGIGLALVKQLVELHGGTVRAASPGLGKGATFTVRLPTVVAPAPATSAPSVIAPTPAAAQADLTGIRVLAVDDDRDSLEVVRRILVARHAVVKPVSSVAQAIDVFEEFGPDVVISDIGMPGQDGYDLIRKIRALPHGAWVPAAALTALARPDDRMRALQAGFQTHVAKPVAAAEVVAVVRSLASLNNHRVADAARN